MTINHENFISSVNKTLNDFFRENLDGYVAFDYRTVQRINNDIKDGKTENKPIFHLVCLPINSGVRESIGTDEEGNKIEGRKTFFEIDIYTIINNSYQENRSRKIILDGIVDGLKNVFDTQGDNLPFKQVELHTMQTNLMGENADNLYAIENRLEFWLYKRM